MDERILIVDADLIAYRFAAAGEQRSVLVRHIKSKKEKIFKTRTAFKEFLAVKDYEYKAEDYEFEDIQTAGDLAFTLSTIKKFLTAMQEFTWSDRIELYLGSGKTFRHDLPLPLGYKRNRDDTLRPIFLKDTREYMIKNYGAKIIEGIEVDDYVTIRSYEEKSKGNYPILVSSDKDSKQSSGITLLNWLNEPWELEDIPDVGKLYKDKSAIKGDGLKFLAFQTIAGDNADTYCGYDLSEVKYGPTKAMNALNPAQTEQEVLLLMVEEFKKLYPSKVKYTDVHGVEHEVTWRDLMLLYWKCSYMKRYKDDPSDLIAFAKERGVEL